MYHRVYKIDAGFAGAHQKHAPFGPGIEKLCNRDRRIVFEALFLQGERRIPKLMRAASISQRTAYNYKAKLEGGGTLDPVPLHRLPTKFTPVVRRSLGQLLARDPEASGRKLAFQLNERFAGPFSSSGVLKTLKKMDNTVSLVQPRQLTPGNKQERLIYAQNHLRIDWDRIWSFDECHFDLWKSRRRVRFNFRTSYRKNVRPLTKSKESISVTFAAAISHNQKSALVELPRNYYVGDWSNVIENELLPSIDWDPSHRRCRAFIIDNDGRHHSREILTTIGLHGLGRIGFLPSNSPDLNPIENVWHIMKQRITAMKPSNEQELRDAVRIAWESITPDILSNLLNSMPERMQDVIDNNGDRTAH